MLTQELMQKVRQLELRMRRNVNEVFAGEFSSAFRGQGMEFSEVREYQPGDEIRAIDWNVTARTGAPYIKRYVEERELTVILMVDRSASNRFGSGSRLKAATMAELSAVLAFAAVRNGDKAGLLAFGEDVEEFVPPKKGTNHVLRIARELLDDSGTDNRAGSQTGTDMVRAIEHLGTALKRKSVVFVVSDFLLPGWEAGVRRGRAISSEAESALRWLARKHDVIAVRVGDRRELELPKAGLVELEDAETGARVLVDTTSSGVRHRFDVLMKEREEALTRQFRRAGVDEARVLADEPYVHELIELFRRREKRR